MGGLLCGFLAGILSGMGVGGGVVLIPVLVLFMDLPQKTAQGINLLYFIPTAIAALVFHVKNNLVEKKLVIYYGGCGVLGAVLGSFIASHLSSKLLSMLFAGFIFLIGVYELFKKRE